jgi:hypothetical protein
MEFMFRIDRLDKHCFSDFLVLCSENVILSLRALADSDFSPIRKTLVHADSVLRSAREMLDLNVNTGHIAGFICASLINEMRIYRDRDC